MIHIAVVEISLAVVLDCKSKKYRRVSELTGVK